MESVFKPSAWGFHNDHDPASNAIHRQLRCAYSVLDFVTLSSSCSFVQQKVSTTKVTDGW